MKNAGSCDILTKCVRSVLYQAGGVTDETLYRAAR